jgi:DNA-binding transcriptional MerR regulator
VSVPYNRAVAEYRIDDLAQAAGTTVRNVRAYQDRGLLAPPRRQGRVVLYDDGHLARLRLIGQLLDRGYPLGAIRDLTEAWDGGRSLGSVLGLVTEMRGPWSDEVPEVITREALLAMFGMREPHEDLLAAVAFGLIVPEGEGFRVPSPRLLRVGQELYAAGVPIADILAELARLRADMERIAARFVALAARPVLDRYVEIFAGEALPPELSDLIARLRPLAQVAVDVELARAMREHAGTHMEEVIRAYVGDRPGPAPTRPQRIEVQGD